MIPIPASDITVKALEDTVLGVASKVLELHCGKPVEPKRVLLVNGEGH
ncbi:hypothetical protein [Gulosibacter sp. 10]|nr:hypothetical protein [Gulosibacter sp. 10]